LGGFDGFLALIAVAVTARLAGVAAPVNTTDAAWIDESDLRLEDLGAQVSRDTDLADYPLAAEVSSNVVMYAAGAGRGRR
jgi:hypothetical protein